MRQSKFNHLDWMGQPNFGHPLPVIGQTRVDDRIAIGANKQMVGRANDRMVVVSSDRMTKIIM